MLRQKELRPGHPERKECDAGGLEACVDHFVTGALGFRVAEPSSLLTWPGAGGACVSVGNRYLDLVAKATPRSRNASQQSVAIGALTGQKTTTLKYWHSDTHGGRRTACSKKAAVSCFSL